jgi:phenylacetate-CoA ligase
VGEVIISNLINRATVLLNYRLDDRGRLASGPCLCGRSLPLLERLEGRRSETIVLADGRVTSSLELEGLFRDELRPTLQVQLVHPTPGSIRWRVVPFASVDREALRRRLLERGREVLGEDTRAEVEFVADIPLTSAGKLQRVVTPIDANV